MDLSLNNVITVSVSAAQTGAGYYNTSNLALFNREVPALSFGSLGYKIYLDPTEVGIDFGTGSNTFAMANAVFSQQPNILAGGGYLVVIPFLSAETMAAAITRTQGLVQYFGALAVEITTATPLLAAAAVVQPLRVIQFAPSQTSADVAPGGLLDLLRTGSFNQTRGLFYGSGAIAAVQSIVLSGTPASGAYTLNHGADATSSLAYNANAATIQTALRLLTGLGSVTVTGSDAAGFVVTFLGLDGPTSNLTVSPNTVLDSLSNPIVFTVATLTVGVSAAAGLTACLVFAASYAGRALSIDFSGSNTTITMHLKDMIGVQPDPSMTQTLLGQCVAAGADTYVSLQGVPKVFTSGANTFFDRIYNKLWFVGQIIIDGFNVLAQSSTKIPQTEGGISALTGAYRGVCRRGITNQYLAPGTWTSSTTFGVQADFLRNIQEQGFYIYSAPIALQSAVDRANRIAPLAQIAIKEAGAVHKGNVIIFINP